MFKVRFDNAMNPERPTLLLSSRSGKIIGQIEADDIDIKDSLKESIEMNFVVYKEKNGVRYPYWDDIINFRLIYWKEHDVWFELTVEFDESEDAIKTCFCTQLGQAELSQINLYNYEINTQNDILRDTYSPTVIYNESNPDGSLLNRLLEKAPHYSVVHVDDSIKNLQRTYTFDNKTIYDALLEVADDIGAIVRVSPIDGETGSGVKRGIAMYDMLYHCTNCGYRSEYLDDGDTCPECHSAEIEHGYGEDTTIFVTRDELAQSIGLSADTDSVKNCYRLSAGDDLMNATVRNINANNSDYMWYLSGDITADMSDGLRNALEAYQEDYVEYHNGDYPIPDQTLITGYNSLVDEYDEAYTQYMRYVYSIPQGDLPRGKALSKITSPISTYNNVVWHYYDTIDFYNFVKSALMPTSGMVRTTAQRQCTKIANRVTEVAVSSLNNVDAGNSVPADNSVLEMVNATLYPGYNAEIVSSEFRKQSSTNASWIGVLKITNSSDPTDTANTAQLTIAVTDDYEGFVLLKVKRTTAQNNVGEITLDEIFEHPLTTFRDEDLPQFGLDELSNMQKIATDCLNIMIEQAYEETWAPGGQLYDMYVDYRSRVSLIQNELNRRVEELDYIESMKVLIENIMTDVKGALKLDDYLNNAQGGPYWNEFSMYRREDEYSNSNFISDGLTNKELCQRAQEFLDEAQNAVYKAIEQQYSISTSLNNLMTIDKFRPLLDSFAVGNWMRVLADNRIYKLRLMGYTINFGDISTVSVDLSEASRYGKGMVGSISTIQDIVNNATKTVTITYNNDVTPVFASSLSQADTTASIASTSAMKSSSDIGGRNILMDTDAPSISKQYAQYDRVWGDTTGTVGSREYITFSGNDLPPINVTHGVRFTISATSSTGARSVRWYSNGTVPIKNDTKYTLSCYARVTDGTTMALWFGYGNGTTTGKTYNISNIGWKKYSWKFTYISGNSGPYIYVGCRPTYTGTIEVCGFQLERGETSSDWKQSPEDDLGQSEAMTTSMIEDFNQKVMARYGICDTPGATRDKVVIIPNFVLEDGAMVAIQFTYANTATQQSPRLQVKSSSSDTSAGVYPIYLNGAPVPVPTTTKSFSYTDADDGTVRTYSSTSNIPSSGWTDSSLVNLIFDGTNNRWNIIDTAALTKIDNILSQNIVGSNAYINLNAGQLDFGKGKLLFNGNSLKVSGTIYSGNGKIGGWDIGSTVLQKFTAQPTSGDQYNIFMQAPTTPVLSPEDSVSRAFGVQKRTFTDGTAGSWSNVFYVNYKGKLYAKDAEITGTISGSTITGSTISGTTINGGTINGTAITGEAISITAKGDITNGTTSQKKYDLALITTDKTLGDLTYKNVLLRARHLNSSGGVSFESSVEVDPTFIRAVVGSSFDIGMMSGSSFNPIAQIGYSNKINFYKDLESTNGAEFGGGIEATGSITTYGSICSGGKASVWDSNAGGIMSAGGVLSLRANSSTTPGLYVTAYGSTTTTYDAGFYYNATETRWQANKQIYATSLLTSGNVTAQRSDTSTPSIIAKNSVGEIALHVAASGNRGVRDNTDSAWLVYKNASTGQREPYATTSNSGFMSPADKTKLNALGTLKGTTTGSGGTVTVPGTSTWTKYGTALTFDEAGLWLVIVNATFDSNSTGRRGLTIDQVTGTWAAYQPEAGTQIHTDIRPASATSYARVVGLVSVAENDMYAINLWSSAGSSTSLTATVRYTCVRLRDN